MNKYLLLAAAALFGITSIHAQETGEKAEELDWYDIEIIVFEHHDLEALGREKWKRDPGTPELRESQELLPPLPEKLSDAHDSKLKAALAFLQLRDEELRLTEKFDQLREAVGYAPLLHIAWRQPGLGPEEARKVHLHGGVNWTLVPTQPPEPADAEPVLPPSGGLAPLPS
ncbi:MAG: hypothetical protein HUJ29_10800, partial [Gammaproteobacteria bacterium]|nr:hypothetical protein [Gammaproteobacteria bacterium]